MQRRRLGALVIEREIEEFVERVVGLVAEPPQDLLSPAACAEQIGVEGKRRELARPLAHRVEPRREIGPLRAKRRAQAALAIPGELEQIVVVETEQRALEHGRQRQIVLRQQQRVGQHHQVHHGDVLGQHQPIGAGNRNASRSSARE